MFYENWPTWLWRLRSPTTSSPCHKLETQKDSGVISSEPEGLRTKDPVVQIPVGRPEKIRRDVSTQASRQEAKGWVPPSCGFCSVRSPKWIGSCPPTLGRAIYFPESTHANAYLVWKHPHRPPEVMFTLGTPWPVKLTHNHHTVLKKF